MSQPEKVKALLRDIEAPNNALMLHNALMLRLQKHLDYLDSFKRADFSCAISYSDFKDRLGRIRQIVDALNGETKR